MVRVHERDHRAVGVDVHLRLPVGESHHGFLRKLRMGDAHIVDVRRRTLDLGPERQLIQLRHHLVAVVVRGKAVVVQDRKELVVVLLLQTVHGVGPDLRKEALVDVRLALLVPHDVGVQEGQLAVI